VQKSWLFRFLLSIISILLFLLLVIMFGIPVFIGFVFAGLSTALLAFKQYKTIGSVELTEAALNFIYRKRTGQHFKVDDSLAIVIRHTNFMGNSPRLDSNTHLLALRVKQGDQMATADIRLSRRAEKKAIRDLLEQWYRNGAKITEYGALNARTFLFIPPNYKEIQALKKKYDIDW
jgi:uncharacterized membrane protein YdbT with pleckstrin-like domain